MQTIDITPTWQGLVPVLVHILQHSESASSRRDITEELTKMAKAADLWNAHLAEQAATLEQRAIAGGTAPKTQTSQEGK